MRTPIALASAAPPTLATGAVIFVNASMARTLHALSQHRPPAYRAEGLRGYGSGATGEAYSGGHSRHAH